MSGPTLNSDRFLEAFNEIEKLLRRVGKKGKEASFYSLVDAVGRSNPAVRQYVVDLKEFADLRNAIVHERTDGHVLAEPNDRAVARLESIAETLVKPPRVIPLFQTEVLTLHISDSAAEAVKSIYERSFSQIPIYDGEEFVAVLTTNTVARWLGACAKEDIFSLAETTIERVLGYAEDDDNHVFLGRCSTLFDAQESFQDYERNGKRLEAILLTENGKPSETLMGIVTIWDLPRIRGAL